jgi:hypothetical protein
VKRRPATLYYLGRSYFANAGYGKAVATLERYIEAQNALGRPLLPTAPAAGVAGIPMRVAPSTPRAAR